MDGLSPMAVNAIIGGIGLAMVALAFYAWFQANAFQRGALSAEAVVVEVEQRWIVPFDGDIGLRGTNARRRPTLEFQTASGEVVRTDGLRSSRSFVLNEGDRIEILYDPEDPKTVALPNLVGPSHAVLFLIGVGGCLAAGAAIGAAQRLRGF